MKKRRVLALLLALSLAVSMNGMTVLATAPDAGAVSAAAEEDNGAVEEGEQAEHTQQPETSGEGEQPNGESGEDTTGDETAPGPADGSGNDTSVGDVSEDQQNPGDQIQDGEPGEGDQADRPADDENKTGSAGESEDQEENPDDSVSEDTENPGEDDLEEDDPEESVSDNTLEEEEVPEAIKPEIRMMTFTDDTGMRITYNVNEVYRFTIEDGVLNGIADKDGNPVKGVVFIPDGEGITSIGTAFQGNKNITYVKLPSGVTAIGESAFSDCSNLEGVYLPNSIKTIGNSAFESCTRLLKIAVPKQVVSIGSRAFYQNTSLFMVYMQDADYSELISIGDYAFYQCGNLENFGSDKEFIVPGELASIGAWAFYGCTSIKELDLHESVCTMGESAFQRCTSLKSVVLSSKLENIPVRAFAGCNKMLSIQFKQGNKTIGEAAFEGCNQLGHVDLVLDIEDIGNDAFSNCGGLVSVRIRNGKAIIGADAFPDDNDPALILIGDKDSTAYQYTRGKNIRFVIADTGSAASNYYKYTTTTLGVTGGKLTVRDANGQDPNKLNKGEGVPYGTELFVTPEYGESIALQAGSVKCNGVALSKASNGAYSFIMPVGGAYITAEFVNKSDTKIQATDDDVKAKVSNGETETNEKGNVTFLNLKVGQYSRVFLTDESDEGRTISSSKIKFSSDKPTIVSVKADGTLQALKAGTAVITAKVTGANDKVITRYITVSVKASGVAQLRIKAIEWDASVVKLEETSEGVQSVLIDVIDSNEQAITFKLRATAYDQADDKVAASLKWSSSDSKVAKLSAASTTVNSTDNTITIPKGASGEATIRVTATVDKNTTITQKFVIRVVDPTPRLAQKSITVNPNHAEGARLQIISAYGGAINISRVSTLIDAKTDAPFNYLKVDYIAAESDSTVSTFRLTPLSGLEDKTYSLKVDVGNSKRLPLTVTVKTSEPKPKIAFEKKQPKINLFYANDETEVKVNVSNLGSDAVSDYELIPLSDKEDDKKFIENFEVEYVDKDTCIIRQQVDNLECANNGQGKPVLTGYLRLYYEGYAEDIHTDCKITIPAQRTAPTYKLNRTTDTFQKGCEAQDIELQLIDKKKQPVDLSAGGYELSVIVDDEEDYNSPVQNRGIVDIDDDGKFVLTLWDDAPAGKVRLRLTNSLLWAANEKFDFVYTVKLSSSTPKISLTDGPESTVALKSSTITVNPNYPDQTVEFGLKSNQKGTVIADDQVFEAKPTKKLANFYQHLDVQYVNGVGSVTVDTDNIADGTYTYVCDKVQYVFNGEERPANKVTLKIKVQTSNPTVTVKGSLTLNNTATTYDGGYEERSELTLITKNLPDGYGFDIGSTEIKCTSKNKAEYVDYFDWELIDRQVEEDGKITEGKLVASMNRKCPKGTYNFSIQPAYSGGGEDLLAQKAVKFRLKVHEGAISIQLSPKGKINLLDRFEQTTAANSIVYTPSIKNVKDKVVDVRVFDNPTNGSVDYDGPESANFEAQILEDGKIYVRPKEDAELKSNETCKVRIWMELENYKFPERLGGGGGVMSKVLSIKTAQTLPKVTTDRSTVNLYLSNKDYVATFIVNKADAKAIGNVESITFGEKDTKAQESFVTTEDEDGKPIVIDSEQLDDGSLLVRLKLRDTVLYGCDTTNKITMYVRFEGQGTNTAGTALTMNVKINK